MALAAGINTQHAEKFQSLKSLFNANARAIRRWFRGAFFGLREN
jgi:hypothetical protein